MPAGKGPGKQGGARPANMKITGGTWSETGAYHGEEQDYRNWTRRRERWLFYASPAACAFFIMHFCRKRGPLAASPFQVVKQSKANSDKPEDRPQADLAGWIK